MNELEQLREQVKEAAERVKEKNRNLYQYARSKGFSSREAALLCKTSKEKIDRLLALKEK